MPLSSVDNNTNNDNDDGVPDRAVVRTNSSVLQPRRASYENLMALAGQEVTDFIPVPHKNNIMFLPGVAQAPSPPLGGASRPSSHTRGGHGGGDGSESTLLNTPENASSIRAGTQGDLTSDGDVSMQISTPLAVFMGVPEGTTFTSVPRRAVMPPVLGMAGFRTPENSNIPIREL
ncbi:MAG: hypothetical protein SGARI_005189, partial [Bacillariaceae sp.]